MLQRKSSFLENPKTTIVSTTTSTVKLPTTILSTSVKTKARAGKKAKNKAYISLLSQLVEEVLLALKNHSR